MQYTDFDDAAFDAFVEATMAEFNTPGMAILVVHKDKTFAKGYGFSDIANQTPVTPETLFFTASTTKSFTSALAAHLVESPEHPDIKWDTPLAELIRDDFVLDQSTADGQWATNHATIEDALSHRTGLSGHNMVWTNGVISNRDIVRALRHVPVTSPLRSRFDYTNAPYTAVSHAIETTLGRPFGDLLKDHIFDPLGMKHTTYDIDDAHKLAAANDDISLARAYLWDSASQSRENVEWSDLPPPRGAGGIISNVLDYSHWVRHLMQPTELNASLSKNAVTAMRTPRTLLEPDGRGLYVGPQAYCLGLESKVYRGREVVDHGGAICGYMTEMAMVPPTEEDIKQGRGDSGWAVVVMQNTFSSALRIIVWHLLDEFLQTPADQRPDMRQMAKDSQARAEKAMLPENVTKRLFGFSAPSSIVQPALEVKRYQGTYSHPAYHKVKITADPATTTQETSATTALRLESSGPTECIAFSATLHHVTAEWWWAHRQYGVRSWITDSAAKLQFVVGPDGTVDGIHYQVEHAMPDHLAFFKKVA
jgi:CubicO group peptidase (beta-lactamase class C family)